MGSPGRRPHPCTVPPFRADPEGLAAMAFFDPRSPTARLGVIRAMGGGVSVPFSGNPKAGCSGLCNCGRPAMERAEAGVRILLRPPAGSRIVYPGDNRPECRYRIAHLA